MKHECDKEIILDMIQKDLREIRQDVKSLLQFKWKVIGGSVAGGFIMTLAYNILKDLK